MLIFFTVHNQQELTAEERKLSTLFDSIEVGKILSSTVKLFNFLPWTKVLKILPWKHDFKEFKETRVLDIHSSNGQMVSSDHCYCDRAHLLVTQSSNTRRDVVSPLQLGIPIVALKSRRPLLLDRPCLSVTQCSDG
jgi:hypothetical protein